MGSGWEATSVSLRSTPPPARGGGDVASLIRPLRGHLLPGGEKGGGDGAEEGGGGAPGFGWFGGGGDVGERADGGGPGVGGDVLGAGPVGAFEAFEGGLGVGVFEVAEELMEGEVVSTGDAEEGEFGGEVVGEEFVGVDVRGQGRGGLGACVSESHGPSFGVRGRGVEGEGVE